MYLVRSSFRACLASAVLLLGLEWELPRGEPKCKSAGQPPDQTRAIVFSRSVFWKKSRERCPASGSTRVCSMTYHKRTLEFVSLAEYARRRPRTAIGASYTRRHPFSWCCMYFALLMPLRGRFPCAPPPNQLGHGRDWIPGGWYDPRAGQERGLVEGNYRRQDWPVSTYIVSGHRVFPSGGRS